MQHIVFVLILLIGTNLAQLVLGSPLLLVSTKQDVRIVDAAAPDNVPPYSLVSQYMKPDAHLYIDYHFRAGQVCWSDISEQTVQCIHHNSSGLQATQSTVSLSGLPYPEGVAVDWLGNVLYWADSKAERVEVVQLYRPHYRRVLYWVNLADINAITLMPSDGLLFWSVWGDSPKIEVASMGGSDHRAPLLPPSRRTLVSRGLRWPNGITVDTVRRLVYWAEAQKDQPCLEAVEFDGRNRRKILTEGLLHPFALSYYGGSLYWTDWITLSIHTCTVTAQGVCSAPTRISRSNTTTYVRVYSAELQRLPNCNSSSCSASPCDESPCSHICLIAPSPAYEEVFFPTTRRVAPSARSRRPVPQSFALSTYQCTCPTGIVLEKDEHTCRNGPSRFLLLARTGGLFRVSLDTPDHTVLPLDVYGTDNDTKHDATDVDYDPVEDEIYWVDVELKAVRATREYSDGSLSTRSILGNFWGNGGFALDPRGRNLYWTDEEQHCIHAASMDGVARMVIVWTNLDRPRAIAVHMTRRLLYWTDWGTAPKIERSLVDGSGRTVVVDTRLVWPNGIVVDEAADHIYWVDGRIETIETARLDGSGRSVLVKESLQHLSGLSLLHSSLYWLDLSERAVSTVSLTGNDRLDILRNVPFIHDIKAVQRSHVSSQDHSTPTTQAWGDSPCAVKRGGCSHLCFHTFGGERSCRCPAHLELSRNNMSCLSVVEAGAFLLYGGGKERLYRLSLTEPHHAQLLPLPPLKTFASMAYDPVEGLLYRSDGVSRSIRRSYLNGSGSEAVLRYGLLLPQAIAVDSVNRNLYWADMLLNRLEVSRLDGSSRRALVWRNIVKPYSIAVEPVTGGLYWFEMGSDSGVIKGAWLDGSHVRVLVQSVGHKVSLAVERSTGGATGASGVVLYWTDSDNRRIGSCDGNGRRRRVLLREVPEAVGVAVWGGRVYWAQQSSHSYTLYSAATAGGGGGAPSVVKSGVDLTDIVFTIGQQQLQDNSTLGSLCLPNNGGCSHLCLPSPPSMGEGGGAAPRGGRSNGGVQRSPCACPTHYTLNAQRKSCLPPTSFLIYGQKGSISRLLDGPTAECPTVVLPIKGARSVGAIAYDPTTHTVYWLDKKSKKIWAAQEHAAKKQIVVDNPQDSVHPHSLALDTVSGLLFLSYALHNTINVTRQSITQHGNIVYTNLGSVVGLPADSPRALTVHSALRLLFFVNMASPTTLIEVCRLDGSRRSVVVHRDLQEPRALTVDTAVDGRLYWFDEEPNRIESSMLDGRDRRVVVTSGLERVVSLAVLRNSLYWVDAVRNRVEKGIKGRPNGTRVTVLERLSELAGIVAVDMVAVHPSEPHPCASTSGNVCSQLCLMTVNHTAGFRSGSVGGGVSTPPHHGAGGVTLPSGVYGASDSIYHDAYREHSPSGVNSVSSPSNSGGVSVYGRVNRNVLYGGGVSTSGGLLRTHSRTRGNSASVYSNSDSVVGGRAQQQYHGAAEGGYSDGSGHHYQEDAGCGCVYGEAVASDGLSCEACGAQHQFTCSRNPLLCVPQHWRCDGVEQCWGGGDEAGCQYSLQPCDGGGCVSPSMRGDVFPSSLYGSNKTAYIAGVVVCLLLLLVLSAVLVWYRRRPPIEDALAIATASAGLKTQQQLLNRGGGPGKGVYRYSGGACHQRLLPQDGSCSVGCLNGSCGGSGCHRNGIHIMAGEMFSLAPTSGAHASSSSSSTTHYPKETVNPPPTPTTRQPSASGCYSNCYHPLQPSSSCNLSSCGNNRGGVHHLSGGGQPHLVYYPEGGPPFGVPPRPAHVIPLAADHSYRHYKTRNRPPPPTPCSTDICDDSDMNSTTLITSTASYSSDTNTNEPPHHHHRRHKTPQQYHPNSPDTQYCSFSSLPPTDYYCDSEPEPPPPTPQMVDRGSPCSPFTATGGRCVDNDTTFEEGMDRGSPNSHFVNGAVVIGGTTCSVEATDVTSDVVGMTSCGSRSDRYYCPPPPSPVASD